MIQVGDRVPDVELYRMSPSGPEAIRSGDWFHGKRVILFALPGAFTPTCSAHHLPGYLERSEEIRSKGVDSIACLSVNDAFVMKAWGEAQSVGDAVEMLADGNGEFARATGLTMDGSGYGLGERSTRFSMIVDDGTLTQLNVESNPSEMDVSSAEHMLGQL